MISIRAATLGDVPGIHALIQAFAARNFLLSRTTGELYETIRDFVIAVDGAGAVVGCSALHIVNARLAELKSLAVAESVQGQGLGAVRDDLPLGLLVEVALDLLVAVDRWFALNVPELGLAAEAEAEMSRRAFSLLMAPLLPATFIESFER